MAEYLYATLSVRNPQGSEVARIALVFKFGEDDMDAELAETVLTKIRPSYTACSILLKVESSYGTRVSIWRDDLAVFEQI